MFVLQNMSRIWTSIIAYNASILIQATEVFPVYSEATHWLTRVNKIRASTNFSLSPTVTTYNHKGQSRSPSLVFCSYLSVNKTFVSASCYSGFTKLENLHSLLLPLLFSRLLHSICHYLNTIQLIHLLSWSYVCAYTLTHIF